MLIKESDIDKILDSLDIDKSGTLDMNEARAFFIGIIIISTILVYSCLYLCIYICNIYI